MSKVVEGNSIKGFWLNFCLIEEEKRNLELIERYKSLVVLDLNSKIWCCESSWWWWWWLLINWLWWKEFKYKQGRWCWWIWLEVDDWKTVEVNAEAVEEEEDSEEHKEEDDERGSRHEQRKRSHFILIHCQKQMLLALNANAKEAKSIDAKQKQRVWFKEQQ